jgi:hypothetical protein
MFFVRSASCDTLTLRSALLSKAHVIDGDMSILFFRLNKDDRRTVQKFESSVKAVVRNQTRAWFQNDVSPDLIDEYFVHCIVYDDEQGLVLKLRLPNDMALRTTVGKRYEVKLSLHGLTFRTTSYNIEFDENVIMTAPFLEVPSTSDVEDDDVSVDEDDIEDMFPKDVLKRDVLDLVRRERDRLDELMRSAREVREKLNAIDFDEDAIRVADNVWRVVGQ